MARSQEVDPIVAVEGQGDDVWSERTGGLQVEQSIDRPRLSLFVCPYIQRTSREGYYGDIPGQSHDRQPVVCGWLTGCELGDKEGETDWQRGDKVADVLLSRDEQDHEHQEGGTGRLEEETACCAHPGRECRTNVGLAWCHAADETGSAETAEELHKRQDGRSERTHCADENHSETAAVRLRISASACRLRISRVR